MIERRLEQLLGAPAETLVTRPVRVQAIVLDRGNSYELKLRSEVADTLPGSRELSAESCEELAAAGAVIIALLVNPEALSSHAAVVPDTIDSAKQPEASAPVPPADEARPPEPSGSASLDERRSSAAAPPALPPALPNASLSPVIAAPTDYEDALGSPVWLVGAAALADLGTLPSVAPGVQGLLGVKWSRVRVEASAHFLPARFASAEDDPNKGGSISLWGAAVQSCFALLAAEVSFGPCAGIEIGSLRGKGRGLRQAEDDQVPWLAAIAGLHLSVPLRGPFSIRLQGLMAVPLVRSSFYYLRQDGGTELLHRPAPLVGRLAVALDMAF